MKKASDLVSNIFNEIQKNEGKQYITFNNSWIDIVGEKLGHNTRIKDIVDGNLIIEIDHPGWKQLLIMKEKSIIREIKKNYSELKVKKIKFYYKNSEDKTYNVEKKVYNQNYISENNNEMDNNFRSLLEKMNKRSEE